MKLLLDTNILTRLAQNTPRWEALARREVTDERRAGDGYLVIFFCDMKYGNPHQLTWAIYLVPGIAWHCVVVFELADDAYNLVPDDPALIFYCAPSFQAFLYRWWLAYGRRQ